MPTLTHPAINQSKEWTGGKIISDEELDAAVQENEYIKQIKQYIEEDKVLLKQLGMELTQLFKPIALKRMRIRNTRARMLSRRKQIQYLSIQLRKKLAFEKIKRLRKELGFE